MNWEANEKNTGNPNSGGELPFNGGELLTARNASDVSKMRSGSDQGVQQMYVSDANAAFQPGAVQEAILNLNSPDAQVQASAQRALQDSFHRYPEQTQQVITTEANNYAQQAEKALASNNLKEASTAIDSHTQLITNYQQYLQQRTAAVALAVG